MIAVLLCIATGLGAAPAAAAAAAGCCAAAWAMGGACKDLQKNKASANHAHTLCLAAVP
jgi:hypothetical protein